MDSCGDAEYDTICAVKSEVGIPVIANGDIGSAQKAKHVLDRTGADAIMIGRAAQGRPWIFREISHYLDTGEQLPPPAVSHVRELLIEHLQNLYAFYGEGSAVRIARKHVAWYVKQLAGAAGFRQAMNQLETAPEQLAAVDEFFSRLAQHHERLIYEQEELAA